jgi:DNA-binding response OmpR family regulator
MRKHFNDQSNIKIKQYKVDINSREIFKNNIKMKLTEKEINTIMYLFKKNKPISIDELEKNVWRYEVDIDTHTVETHIYRLRKKILEKFDDEFFITSKKNGYEIN